MMSQVGESPSSRLSGLLTRDLPNGMTQQYASVGREAPLLLGESHSILLPNVTCGDAGLYTCYLAAPLGEQNREGQVLLTLTGESQMLGSRGFADLRSFRSAVPNIPSSLMGKIIYFLI